jgi:hypothetical protein
MSLEPDPDVERTIEQLKEKIGVQSSGSPMGKIMQLFQDIINGKSRKIPVRPHCEILLAMLSIVRWEDITAGIIDERLRALCAVC